MASTSGLRSCDFFSQTLSFCFVTSPKVEAFEESVTLSVSGDMIDNRAHTSVCIISITAIVCHRDARSGLCTSANRRIPVFDAEQQWRPN